MAWYKIDIRHGPGHQSRTVVYKFFDKSQWKGTKKALEQEVFDTSVESWWEWPVGRVTEVVELPEAVRQEKLGIYRAKINEAERMVAILSAVQPHRYYAIVSLKNGKMKMKGVARDDTVPSGEYGAEEITKEQFDLYIDAEDRHKPTLKQLRKQQCTDCRDKLGVPERVKRGCYTECFVRPHTVLV